MSAHEPADDRTMLVAAASFVAGSGLVIWSLASLARSRGRTGPALLAGIGGAVLVASSVLGEDTVALASSLLGAARPRNAGGGYEPEDDPVDVASMDSFPASDPPSTTGATAQVTRRGLMRARAGRG